MAFVTVYDNQYAVAPNGSFTAGDTTYSAIEFTAGADADTVRITVKVLKSGSPVGDLECHIYSKSGTDPGISLGNGVIVPGDVTASYQELTATDFSATLVSGTNYFVVLYSPDSNQSAGNLYRWGRTTTLPTSGWQSTNAGVSWSSFGSRSLHVLVEGEIGGGGSGTLYRSKFNPPRL